MGVFTDLHTFESLRLRDYRLLWLGQLSATMGLWMDQVARGWLMYTLTGSPMELGLVAAARGLPLLVFGAIAGAVADRYGRKSQLVIAQIANTVLSLILALLLLTDQVLPWHVYVTAFLTGTVQTFVKPARQAIINDLVSEKHLFNAVSLNSAGVNLSRSVGPALAGILIQALGVDMAYFVQAGLSALATVWTVRIKVPKRAEGTEGTGVTARPSILDSTREGMAYILSNRLILALMVLGLVPSFIGMPFVTLMPVFAVDVFQGGADTQGLLLTLMGIGAVAGALTMASLGRAQANGKMVTLGAAAFGLSLIFFSQSPVLALAGFFMLTAGFFNSGYTTQEQTILQMLCPPRLLGRVLGVYLLDQGLVPLGGLLAGALATFFGGPWTVMVMGVSCLLLTIGVRVFAPDLWKLRFADESIRGRG